jgi:hypothetical protein
VAHLRDLLRHSRIGRWIKGHRNLSAAAAALLAVGKVWRWLIFDLARIITHPGGTVHWVGAHALLAVALSLAVFVIAFVATRLGIDWFSADDDKAEDEPAKPGFGPAWAERPYDHNATRIPPRMG